MLGFIDPLKYFWTSVQNGLENDFLKKGNHVLYYENFRQFGTIRQLGENSILITNVLTKFRESNCKKKNYMNQKTPK